MFEYRSLTMGLHIILGGVALVMIIIPLESATTDDCPSPVLTGSGSKNFVDKLPTSYDLSLVLYSTNPPNQTTFKLSAPMSDLLNCDVFDSSLPLTIFHHGFRTTPCLPILKQIPDGLLQLENTNVFVLNISDYMNGPYDRAVYWIKYIGNIEGEWLANYSRIPEVNEEIHLIGHSLGAHLSGFAGKSFASALPGEKIAKITALDPAGPSFEGKPTTGRLCKTDASFVTVIHTNAGGLGIIEASGHVDFYPNGGTTQPNADGMESHKRCWKYLVESMYYPFNFPAVSCPSRTTDIKRCTSPTPNVFMGYNVTSTAAGIYKLVTNGNSPYGLGKV